MTSVSDDGEQKLLVIPTCVPWYEFREGLVVGILEPRLYVLHINFRSGNDDPCQRTLIGSRSLHALVELMGVIRRRIPGYSHNRQHALQRGSRKFRLQRFRYVLVAYLIVMLKHALELLVGPRSHYFVE